MAMDPMAIYEDLKEKIIWLDIEPGATLNLVELADNYGVSRNPVMIALTRLHTEEWVVRHGTHFVVSLLTIDRMRNITEIRLVMETQGNIWAMNRITSEGLARLEDIHNQIQAIKENIDKKEIVRLDFKFHQLLYRETRNQQLAQLLERLLAHYLRFWLAGHQKIEPEGFFSEALEIYEAVKTKDETRLKAATVAHIKVSLDKIMDFS